jgi:long-chain acyl-CoA synthetase
MRVFDILEHQVKTNPEKPAFGFKKDGRWQTISFAEYGHMADQLSLALINKGVGKEKKVASVTFNKPEWNILDMAILQAGAIHVALYPNYNFEDLSHSLDYTDVEYVFVSGKLLFDQVKRIQLQNPKIKAIYSFESCSYTNSIYDLIKSPGDGADLKILEHHKGAVAPDAICAIYLTSGTTGKSKGAMVSHEAIVNTVKALKDIYDINYSDRAISYAPLSVSSERSLNYFYQLNGICTYYAENMLSIIQNMQEIKPTIFLGSPMLLEKIQTGTIEKAGELKGLAKTIFKAAVDFTAKFEPQAKLPLQARLLRAFFDKIVYERIRGIMGGQVRFIMAGGASIPPEIMRFFWMARIPVYEGFGMTECHVISVNCDKRGIKFGTVGPLFRDVEIRIDENGEVLCRSPYLFLGYYKMPELSSTCFDKNGFFKTGDKGLLLENNYLKIIGRLKDIFKTAAGKYVAPEVIEKKLNNSLYIQQCIVAGANEKFISVLIVPNFSNIKKLLLGEHAETLTQEQIIADERVLKEIQKVIDEFNIDYSESEQIRGFKLLSEVFSIENGELTPSMKLKRHAIEDKFKSTLEEIYA